MSIVLKVKKMPFQDQIKFVRMQLPKALHRHTISTQANGVIKTAQVTRTCVEHLVVLTIMILLNLIFRQNGFTTFQYTIKNVPNVTTS